MLTSKQRAYLRSLAMSEDTIIIIGKGGITENVVTQVRDALKARELVKGKVLENSLLSARMKAWCLVPFTRLLTSITMICRMRSSTQ